MTTPDIFSDLRIPVALGASSGKVTAPSEFMILANGTTETLKGPIRCSEHSCARVLDAMRAAGRDKLPLDYNHGQVSWNGDARAAGWFVPASRDGALWATQVEWTPRALAELSAKEWRYFSPALFRDENGNVTELVNVALTNLPATLHQTPLVTSQFGEAGSEDEQGEPDAPRVVQTTLSAEQREMCERLGISEADFLAEHNRLASEAA